eukprot:scaffold25542_cov60-Cyclotella_meneghiniana.AAC.5
MVTVKSAASAALPAFLLVLLTVILYCVTYQSLSAAVTSIVAWNVIVKTLELNDFRHRIKKSPLQGSRYIAAFVATRLGLRDAIRDWCIIYSVLYAIVAGITWEHADPNSLLVLWGVSVMISALILAFLGLKIPHWLGHYPKSGLQIISDTSNLSEAAVQSLVDGGSINDFRYQVRIAIGTDIADESWNLNFVRHEKTKASGSHAVFAKCTQNYEKIVAEESAQNEPIKWYSRLWLASPVKPALDTFMLGFKRTFSCCQKESGKYPCCQQSQSSQIALPYSTYYQTKLTCDLSINLAYRKISPLNKIFFILSSIVGIGLSGYALYVTIVACGATLLYSAPDLGPVCAFNHKGGSIKSFANQREAHLANYQIAHCGVCGHCSNWIDLELEYSTRKTLAVQSQKCAIKSLFSGGFAGTAATCEEANCEAGNPGNFVGCSGATRRRMNITSGIMRPDDQQCHIVDVKSWEEFFPPQN